MKNSYRKNSINKSTQTDLEANDITYVTKPYLPELEEFLPYLEKIWTTKQLTNNGPFLHQFEKELSGFLGVKHITAVTNGTIALLVALRALNLRGEVITTPYTFIATANSLLWSGLIPVFADVDPSTGNISPSSIKKLITKQTCAILAVHVYGTPCEVESIDAIGKEHNIKIIYDAAHAFGVTYKDLSILQYGDISVLSFHATKSFTTMEGGAVVTNSAEVNRKICLLQNFGIADETSFEENGINGKMDEFRAALGLLQIKDYHKTLAPKKAIAGIYNDELSNIPGIEIFQPHSENYTYYPIVLTGGGGSAVRDRLYNFLMDNGIHTRRYFYPCISNIPLYKNIPSANKTLLPNANYLADRVLCLPLYYDLEHTTVYRICTLIKDFCSKIMK